jgi:hypothetical protein
MSEKEKVAFTGKEQDQDALADVSQGTPAVEQELTTEPQYLTREEAQHLFEEQKNDLLRQTQSLTDKASSRLDKKLREEIKKVNDVIDLQKKAGITITPEQERVMRQMAYDNALGSISEDAEDLSKGAAKPQEINDPEQMAKAAAAVIGGLANDIYKQAGVTIYENDPEVDLIDQSSPIAFLDSIKAATEKKKQRIQTAPEARIASLGKGQSTNLEAQMIAQYEERKSKIQGDVEALIALKKEFRSKGLQVK